MKVCIVGFNDRNYMPYMEFYYNLLLKNNIEADVICWNREVNQDISREREYIIGIPSGSSKVSKVIPLLKWKRKVEEYLNTHQYDRVIVLTTLPAILLSSYLIKHYAKRYTLDIRDYTYEKYWFYKQMLKKLMEHAYMTSISSAGFKTWLPQPENVYLNHNIPMDYQGMVKEEICFNSKDTIRLGYVGTIGYDHENIKLINAFKNDFRYNLQYHGVVSTNCNLPQFCHENQIQNVVFTGKFDSKKKSMIYETIDMIIATYGNESYLVNSALPNKLYDCVLYKKPIIVSEKTYLAEVVTTYNLGCSVGEEGKIKTTIQNYIEKFNAELFLKGCQAFLEDVNHDLSIFIEKFNLFLQE